MKAKFERVEYKYKVNKKDLDALFEEIVKHMNLDDHCKENYKYLITNYYVDTSDLSLIRKSVSKPKYKQKMRIRTYDNGDDAFFEIKKKYKKVVYKRRIKLPKEDAFKLVNKQEIDESNISKQILNEIKYFLSLDDYKVVNKISYDRIAFHGKDDPGFRISFDYNIMSNVTNSLIEDDKVLMEIKTKDKIEFWLVELLNKYEIRRQSFSKYGTEYYQRLKEA